MSPQISALSSLGYSSLQPGIFRRVGEVDLPEPDQRNVSPQKPEPSRWKFRGGLTKTMIARWKVARVGCISTRKLWACGILAHRKSKSTENFWFLKVGMVHLMDNKGLNLWPCEKLWERKQAQLGGDICFTPTCNYKPHLYAQMWVLKQRCGAHKHFETQTNQQEASGARCCHV